MNEVHYGPLYLLLCVLCAGVSYTVNWFDGWWWLSCIMTLKWSQRLCDAVLLLHAYILQFEKLFSLADDTLQYYYTLLLRSEKCLRSIGYFEKLELSIHTGIYRKMIKANSSRNELNWNILLNHWSIKPISWSSIFNFPRVIPSQNQSQSRQQPVNNLNSECILLRQIKYHN